MVEGRCGTSIWVLGWQAGKGQPATSGVCAIAKSKSRGAVVHPSPPSGPEVQGQLVTLGPEQAKVERACDDVAGEREAKRLIVVATRGECNEMDSNCCGGILGNNQGTQARNHVAVVLWWKDHTR